MGDHVNPDDDTMKAKALDHRTTGGVATRWASLDIAQEAVDKAVTQWLEHSPDNVGKLQKWQTEQAQRMGKKKPTALKTIEWEVRDLDTKGAPIGYKWVKSGTTADKFAVTSRKVVVQLKYIGRGNRAHPHGKWVVYTAYLEG
nr:RNase A-like domain-containing protein [Streptomyces aureus]